MILAVLLIFISTTVAQDLYEGEACDFSGAGPGVCTMLTKCPVISQQIKAGNLPVKLCAYSGFESVVCCPSNSPTAALTPMDELMTKIATEDSRGALARQKCREYAKFVWSLKYPTVSISGSMPVNTSDCAFTSKKLIVGGKHAEPKEFPHMAAIGYVSESGTIVWRCGGTLISEKFVLTAAHCIRASGLGNAEWVRVGDLNLQQTNDGATPVDRRIAERIQHPQYKRPAQYYDIGLLRLGSRVPFNAWIRPACLHTKPTTGTDKAIATGWGHVDWGEEEGSEDLLKVTLPLVSHETCSRSYPANTRDETLPNGVFEDRMLCAGEAGMDTCQGDSGGPLVIYSIEPYCMYDIVGVTSVGKLCGRAIPGIYSRVHFYINWIESVVWK